MDRLKAAHAFVRLVELGTFSAAAEDLRIKQSTVSKWVAGLEAELGVPLVERTTRRMRVTEAGHTFYGRARALLATYDEAVAELQAAAPELQGRLRVSVPVVFGRRFVSPWVPTFLAAHPGIELDLLFDDRYADLLGEDLDVALRVGAPVDSTWKSRKLGDSVRRVVAAPAYLSSRGRPARPSDLARHECLLHSGLPAGAPWRFERAGRSTRVKVRGRLRANNSEALLTAALAGHGVALLADWLVDPHVSSGALEVLLEGYGLPPAPIYALTAPGRAMHPRARAFVEAFSEQMRPAT